LKEIKTDVLVIGAGAAGIAAAVSASEHNLRVVVVEKCSIAGGNATIAEVGTICGLYHNSFSGTEFLVRGFAREFAEKLQSLSQTVSVKGKDGLHYLPYKIQAFSLLGMEYLQRGNITCFFNHEIREVNTQQNTILSLGVMKDNEVTQIVPATVIDCSGNSIVARLSNLPVITEREYQSAAQVFTMRGINEDREDRLSLQILKAIVAYGDEELVDGHLPKLYLVPGSLSQGRASFKIALPFTIKEGADQDQHLAESARNWVKVFADFLVVKLASFKNASVDHIAVSPGFRVAARTKGKYILTGNDVRNCRRFEDAIARCSWPIEEWNETGRVHMEYLPEYGYYEIPPDCLIAETAHNLFMAGRIISADRDAIASARVMGICLQTGYAAGILASGKILATPIQDTIQEIRRLQMDYI